MPVARRKTPKQFKVADLKFPVKQWHEGEIGISQSLMTAFMKCNKTLLFSLNRWETPGTESNFLFGNIVHEMLDIVYSECSEQPTPEFLSEQIELYIEELRANGELYWLKESVEEEYKAVAQVTLEAYFEHYADDFKFEFIELERMFDVQWNGFRLIGKKDGLFKHSGKKWLFEHKTKGQINETALEQYLELDFQTFYYILADEIERGERADGTCYNVIRRFKGGPGKTETLPAFCKRLKEIIRKDPEHFFKRWHVEYTDAQHEQFRHELLHKFKHLESVLIGKSPLLRNESNCFSGFPCDYLKACAQGTMSGYKQRKFISPELQTQ